MAMVLAPRAVETVTEMLQFCCPACGKLLLKYDRGLVGRQELECGKCSWRDLVYWNCTPEELNA